MERLKIQNFVTLHDIELELKKLNILIGPQASGKSLVAKIITFVKDIRNITVEYLREDSGVSYLELLEQRFKRIFPSYTWEKKLFEIEYVNLSTDFSINIKNQGSRLVFTFGEISFIDKIASFSEYLFKNKPKDDEEKNTMMNGIMNKYIMAEQFVKDVLNLPHSRPCYIPSGRSFYSSVQKSFFNITSNDLNVDYFISRFGSDYELTKSFIANGVFEESNPPLKFRHLVNKLLQGKIERDSEGEWISNDENKIKVSHSSSGQQESVPVVTFLSVWPFSNINYYSNLIIEEPEAHLFPVAQNIIITLIAMAFSNKDSINYTITTHSPYIISSLNNLLLASIIVKEHPEKAEMVYKLVPKEAILDFNEVAAYQISKDGIKSILDEEQHLISSDYIDNISREISGIFDNLLDIEFEG
ncbi:MULTISPECIES: AAA family ATPase [Proteus]|uniref:AAA family ATPase n=1 Tax=Proteus TaxID=583 RepID=UPI0013768D3C|nr:MULTISPECIES: AAA family ATPase [Proteus]MBG2839203.1 AAA family ATPase [Proteus terrae subsp. cibarius]MBG2870380.1 AAA family ATPase [Proteus terrae subsp. cibarius]NBN85277.1 AAA family ATPase [Proteus sp. G2300]